MTIQETCNLFKVSSINADLLTNENLSKYTSFKVGGVAPLLLIPKDTASLLQILDILSKNALDFYILGGGTNVVISDKGFLCPVILTTRLDNIKQKDDTLVCGAGVKISCIIDFALNNTIEGLCEFAGLPGTVGGAVFMNARCFEKQISDVLVGVDYIKKQNNDYILHHYDFCADDWGYKVSPFNNSNNNVKFSNCIITGVTLKAKKSTKTKQMLQQKCKYFIKQRTLKGHYRLPCAGSVFKNNRLFGVPTGKIIQDLGLCGYCIGHAQIAPWHGNIIVNTGGALASDIKKLCFYIKDTVKQKTGFDLQPEIIFCGA